MAPSREISDMLRADVTCSPVQKAANEFGASFEKALLEPMNAVHEVWQNCQTSQRQGQGPASGTDARSILSDEHRPALGAGAVLDEAALDADKTFSTAWCAHLAGNFAGQLPWLLLTHSVAAQSIDALAEKELLPTAIKESELNLTTSKAALTGFAFSGMLQPTRFGDSADSHFFESRLKNGISGALSFATMARTNIYISDIAASRVGASALLANPFVSGFLSGGSGAVVGSELNSAFNYGRVSSSKELIDSIASQALIGSSLSAMGRINMPKEQFGSQASSLSGSYSALINKVGEGGVVLRSDNTVMKIAKDGYVLNEGDQVLSEATRKVLGAKFHTTQDVSRMAQQLTDMQSELNKLSQENKHLQEIATIDSLTKIKNVLGGENTLQKEFERAANRTNTPLSVLFLDLNGFKKVNDQIGHDAGDSALVRGAGIISERIRQTDDVYRKGGDEFVVILPDTDYLGACKLARGIKENLRFEVRNADCSISLPVSTSIGIATFDPINRNFASTDALLHEADQQMYLDKHQKQANVIAH